MKKASKKKKKVILPRALILMGSDSDLTVMEKAGEALEEMGIPYEMDIASAHRTPERTKIFAKLARESGIEVIIAGAGMAAHLAGAIASHTTLPVIGVPIKSGELNGLDALYSTVQMPPGIPVATVSIDGAKNAAILACQILANKNKHLVRRLEAFRERMAEEVAEKSKKLKERKKNKEVK